jgi:4-amino-4-deoxy-L-arabinose transferase-like glycosyltransferase
MKQGETPTLWRWLVVAAVLSFIPSLFFPYVGEEGVYTISTLEMWHGLHWSNPLLFGGAYGRPPFLNWVILPVAMLLGPQHILIASRLVTAGATVLTAAALFGFARGLGATARHAALAVLVFLSSDALLYHGWIAYADPLFSLLTFGAMGGVLLAARRETLLPLALAVVLVTAAFLTKALTAYVFVAVTWLIVFMRHRESRTILLSPPALFCYAVAIAAPFVWFHFNGGGGHGIASRDGGAMTADIVNKLVPADPRGWLKQIVAFPVETLCRFLPVTAVVAYGVVRDRATDREVASRWDVTVAVATLLNFLPYWLAPQSSIRYILPLYPFIAYCLGGELSRMSVRTVRIAVWCIASVIALKYVAMVGFPIYQSTYRGSAMAVAKDIVAITGTAPVYDDDSTSVGLSIAGNVDALRWPSAPLTWLPGDLHGGWILTRQPGKPATSIVLTRRLGRDTVYLLCSGRACAVVGKSQ